MIKTVESFWGEKFTGKNKSLKKSIEGIDREAEYTITSCSHDHSATGKRCKVYRRNTANRNYCWVYGDFNGGWPVSVRFADLALVKPEVYKAKPKAKRVALTAQNLTLRNLETAEDLFLRSNGWKPARGGGYRPPKGYETASIRQGNTYPRQHAVNSQRKMLGGT